MSRSSDIQYGGMPGVSKSCVDAVLRLMQFGDRISEARILSCSNRHCLLLKVNGYETLAIKSGFGSGYGGEGPRSFSLVLRLLADYGAEVDEYEVTQTILERIDTSSLTEADLARLDALRPVRPMRWYQYLLDRIWEKRGETAWGSLPPVIPYGIIDGRILDLALRFFQAPDNCLITGYRRLEDIVKKRTGIDDEYGPKLFSQAFSGDKARLTWPDLGASERAGRAQLFAGAHMAYRNPRAHRELEAHVERDLAEFLLLNHLYLLESQSEEAPGGS